ncbi:IclR family transcriptional regulator [Rugosimonospora africana]|uniref:IclR family transcriptional regulator n=1 Tax=Rugosimonospora africana TaxID=556532 RepID=A0A8J3R3E9_9ACTN|nr:helix-turn-helix domain-containing protein [Rugosimonospora africana]GIH21157.1 IclR family transcriptional regulator [Rugosimonospora africana]
MGVTEQAGPVPGRGVLAGAFRVLDALSAVPDGAGLSEVSRRSGLAKATTYRLLEQLVAAGAVQRCGQRYLIGQVIARLAESWRPDPALRQAALAPVRALATLSGCAVAVTVLHGDRLAVVAGARGSVGELPRAPVDADLASCTAAGQTLLAALPNRDRPDALSAPQWRRLRALVRGDSPVVVDHQDVVPGICCVATPISLGIDAIPASISVIKVGRSVPAGLPDLVHRAAAQVTRNFPVR